MKLAELRDLIRAEAGLNGLNEYTALIDNIVNQELQELTQKSNYPILLTAQIFTSPADGTSVFTLPADFQRLSSLDYLPNPISAGVIRGYQLSRGTKNGYLTNTCGYPYYYSINGLSLQIYPYTSFFLNDTLTLSYYKRPQLILDDDEFPIPSLEKAVQQLSMGRLLRMVDTKRAQMATLEGKQAWLSSRSDAGD